MGDYRATYDRSIRYPEGFWGEAAVLVDWIEDNYARIEQARADLAAAPAAKNAA